MLTPLTSPITSSQALRTQLEKLSRSSDHPYAVVKANNTVLYALELVGDSIHVCHLTNPKDTEGEVRHENGCKVYRFSNNPKYPKTDGAEFLQWLGKQGNELFIIPNYIPLDREGDNGIGADFVSECPSLFCEFDEGTIEQQWEKLNEFSQATGLSPSLVIHSGGKSLHIYFRLSEPISDKQSWQTLQRKLIILFGSDPQIQNPNREMRLAGVNRASKGRHQSVQFVSDCSYSTDEIESALDAGGRFPYGIDDERFRRWRREGDHVLALTDEQLYPQRSDKLRDTRPVDPLIEFPLEIVLTRHDRELIERGAGQGERNSQGAKLAVNSQATADRLSQLGYRFTGSPEQLFNEFCSRCSPALSARESEQIWRSASRGNPTPSLSDEMLENCIRAWQWQQLPEHKKQQRDRTISEDEWELRFKLPDFLKKLYRGIKRPGRGFAPKPPESPLQSPKTSLRTYESGQRLDTWAASGKWVCDSSSTGQGKSFDAGMATPELFGSKGITYITSDPRNVTVPTLKSWAVVEGRHDGLKRDQHGKLRHRQKDEKFSVRPNCSRTDTIGALRNAGVENASSAELICKTCPHFEPCKAGVVFGYLGNRRDALSQQRKILHPASSPNAEDYDYSSEVLIWDEWSKILANTRELGATVRDLDKTIATLATQAPELFANLQQFLTQLRKLLTREIKQPNRYGWGHRKLVEQLAHLLPDDLNLDAIASVLSPDLGFLNKTAEHGVDMADLPASARKKLAERDSTTAQQAQELVKQWLNPVLKILKGEAGYLSLNYGILTITQLDNRLIDIAHAAKKNIFMDATGHFEELAALLGISVDQINHIAQENSQGAELNITQVSDFGRMGQQRGKEQQRRGDAVIEHLLSERDRTGVIRFKRHAGEKDYRWFIESRACNDLEELNTLILDGVPCPNLEQLKAEYTCTYGTVPTDDDSAFKQFVNRRILAEIKQAIGRLRASRRAGEKLEVIILGDFPLDELGMPVEQIKASDITLEAASKRERLELALKGAVEKLHTAGEQITQSAIARLTGYSQGYISRFRELLQMLLENLQSKSNSPPKPPPDYETAEWLGGEYLPLVATEELPDELNLILESYPPHRWRSIFEAAPPEIQTSILKLLMLALPPEVLQEVSG